MVCANSLSPKPRSASSEEPLQASSTYSLKWAGYERNREAFRNLAAVRANRACRPQPSFTGGPDRLQGQTKLQLREDPNTNTLRAEAVAFNLKSPGGGLRPFRPCSQSTTTLARFPPSGVGTLPWGGTSGSPCPAPTRSLLGARVRKRAETSFLSGGKST